MVFNNGFLYMCSLHDSLYQKIYQFAFWNNISLNNYLCFLFKISQDSEL